MSSFTSILHKLGEEIHLVVALIALGAFVIWEVWAHLSKHERISYRAYLWVILMFLLATNLSMFKLLHGEMLTPKSPDALEQIASTGRIRIGISHVAWGPFLCLDEEKVELTGFDIEMAEKVADTIRDAVKRRGGENDNDIRHNFILFGWKALLEAVKNNDVDFAISAITRNDERALKYDLLFSESYYKTKPSYAMFANSDDSTMLTGRKAIVIEGTTSYDVAKELVGESPIERDNWFRAFTDFRASRYEHPIIVDDDTFMRYRLYRMKLMSEVDIRTVDEKVDEYGIAVNSKQGVLLSLINHSIGQLKKNGDLSRLQDKWLKGQTAKERCLKELG